MKRVRILLLLIALMAMAQPQFATLPPENPDPDPGGSGGPCIILIQYTVVEDYGNGVVVQLCYSYYVCPSGSLWKVSTGPC